MIRVKDYDEALAMANDTEFGLSAGIVTTSLKHATHFQRNAEAGMVMVNVPTAGVDYPRAVRRPEGLELRSAGAGLVRQGVLHAGEDGVHRRGLIGPCASRVGAPHPQSLPARGREAGWPAPWFTRAAARRPR